MSAAGRPAPNHDPTPEHPRRAIRARPPHDPSTHVFRPPAQQPSVASRATHRLARWRSCAPPRTTPFTTGHFAATRLLRRHPRGLSPRAERRAHATTPTQATGQTRPKPNRPDAEARPEADAQTPRPTRFPLPPTLPHHRPSAAPQPPAARTPPVTPPAPPKADDSAPRSDTTAVAADHARDPRSLIGRNPPRQRLRDHNHAITPSTSNVNGQATANSATRARHPRSRRLFGQGLAPQRPALPYRRRSSRRAIRRALLTRFDRRSNRPTDDEIIPRNRSGRRVPSLPLGSG